MGSNFCKIGIKNYKALTKRVDRMRKAPEKVQNGIVGEFKKRAPAWIANEVVKVYNIKKAEIKPSQGGKRAVGSVSVKGKTIGTVSLVYRGRLLTHTHFGMTPKAPPSGGYTLKAQVLKGKKKTLGKVKKLTKKQRKQLAKNFRNEGERKSPKSPIMLMGTGSKKEGGTNFIPFQRVSPNRKNIEAIKTVSMPQMVSNKTVSEGISAEINKKIGKRLDHYMDRYMK